MVSARGINCVDYPPAGAVGNPPRKRVNKGLARLQKRLKTLCEDRVQGSKSIPEFLEGVGHNIRVNKRL